MIKNFLITSAPGTGKTTTVKRFVQLAWGRFSISGFFTEEVREEGRRKGFKIVTVDGKIGILADENFKSPFRVGRYGVNIEDVERVAVPSIDLRSDVIVIDEIGKMECFSKIFIEKVFSALDSDSIVVATIKKTGDGIYAQIKARDDVKLIPLTIQNRDKIPKDLIEKVEEILKSKSGGSL